MQSWHFFVIDRQSTQYFSQKSGNILILRKEKCHFDYKSL